MTQPSVLVTGASGYIGSHTCVCLLQNGWHVIGIDNFSNSSPNVIRRIEQIAQRSMSFHRADIRDSSALSELCRQQNITAVIHFAGLKSVSESVSKPLDYFDNNVCGSVTLLRVLQQEGVRQLVFSSSATVYGEPNTVPVTEDAPTSATNPYGRSKLIVEQMLSDLIQADPTWRIATLRYFNPVGAHESGLIGEDPRDIPNNLMPFIAQVAVGRRHELRVFGDDYPTIDGSGVRDYIHVMDLARGHLAALDRLSTHAGSFTVNLGTGRGISVLQAVAAFEQASGRTIPTRRVARRSGDIATCYASPARAEALLGWQAEYDLDKMCTDHWRWQRNNPDGY
jgi:UDP-glucose 4-epimerase